jgi:hypothetical protein
MAVLTSLLGMYRRWLKITPIISGLNGGGKLGILCRPTSTLRYSGTQQCFLGVKVPTNVFGAFLSKGLIRAAFEG